MDKIYTVKEAALILEFSTNTLYKYLEDGTLESARGVGKQTRIRFPHSALETYLGSPLSEDHVLEKLNPTEYARHQVGATRESLTSTSTNPRTFPLLLARILIILSLLGIILDLILSQTFNLTTQLLRMGMIAIFVLLAYQFGGYKDN